MDPMRKLYAMDVASAMGAAQAARRLPRNRPMPPMGGPREPAPPGRRAVDPGFRMMPKGPAPDQKKRVDALRMILKQRYRARHPLHRGVPKLPVKQALGGM